MFGGEDGGGPSLEVEPGVDVGGYELGVGGLTPWIIEDACRQPRRTGGPQTPVCSSPADSSAGYRSSVVRWVLPETGPPGASLGRAVASNDGGRVWGRSGREPEGVENLCGGVCEVGEKSAKPLTLVDDRRRWTACEQH